MRYPMTAVSGTTVKGAGAPRDTAGVRWQGHRDGEPWTAVVLAGDAEDVRQRFQAYRTGGVDVPVVFLVSGPLAAR